ncbi:MAG: hypothetical protein Q9P90_03455 [candidate division KSB1 bacterium]|nr:hypothetical protein [candidate division KSB1 bacterium]
MPEGEGQARVLVRLSERLEFDVSSSTFQVKQYVTACQYFLRNGILCQSPVQADETAKMKYWKKSFYWLVGFKPGTGHDSAALRNATDGHGGPADDAYGWKGIGGLLIAPFVRHAICQLRLDFPPQIPYFNKSEPFEMRRNYSALWNKKIK